MSSRIAIVTPARLDRPTGDSLRPLAQARGLWALGRRDFVLYSAEPDPALPYEQERVRVRGPLQLVEPPRARFALVHAHQNAGLFFDENLLVDLHGLAPLESRLAWRRRPASPRAALFAGFAQWATGRLLARARHVVCASESIAENLHCWRAVHPSLTVARNAVAPEDYPPHTCDGAVVAVLGGFTSRWGASQWRLGLEVARRCPGVRFRFVGAHDAVQARAAAGLANVELAGVLPEAAYREVLQSCSIGLLAFEPWCRGGGARQKLLQSAASGHALVATPAGLEGFAAPEGAVWSGEGAADMALGIAGPLAARGERRRRGDAARAQVACAHDLMTEARKLSELYDRLSQAP